MLENLPQIKITLDGKIEKASPEDIFFRLSKREQILRLREYASLIAEHERLTDEEICLILELYGRDEVIRLGHILEERMLTEEKKEESDETPESSSN